jgi:hypothetical protein
MINKDIILINKGIFIPLPYHKADYISFSYFSLCYFFGLSVSLQFLVGSFALAFTSQSLLRILVPLLPLGLVTVALGLLFMVRSMRSAGSNGVAGMVGSPGVVTVEFPFTPAEPAPVSAPTPTDAPTPAAKAVGEIQSEPANKNAINDKPGLINFMLLLLKFWKNYSSETKINLL